MSKKISKNLRELENASKSLSSFQKFCYIKIKKYSVKEFLGTYILTLFAGKNYRQGNSRDRILRIKTNLAKFDDVITDLIILAFDEDSRKLKISDLKSYLSEIKKGWPVRTLSQDRKICVKRIPTYLITANL